MAKSRNASSFWAELTRVGLYKRNQGRLTRQRSAIGFLLVVFLGAWTLSQGPLAEFSRAVRVGVPLGICVVAAWVIYRVVNFPKFADFLISVEAEMDKVSWASTQELIRATAVVLTTMIFLGLVLMAYDVFWQFFFRLIHFLEV